MKKWICLILSLCILCNIPIIQVFAEQTEQNTIKWHNHITLTPSPYTEQDFDNSGAVTLRTEYSKYNYDVENIAYIFQNNTAMSPTFGIDTELEIYLNEQWYQIPLHRCIDDVAFVVNAKSEAKHMFRWNIEDYDLSEGKYRIIKELSDMQYGKLGAFGKKKYYAVFEIKNLTADKSIPQHTIMWNDMELKSTKYSKQDFDRSNDVEFYTQHTVYDKDIKRIAYMIENHTALELNYGYHDKLEVFLNGEWYEIPLHRDIDDTAMTLRANGKIGDVFYWNKEEYDLPEGKYRMIKELNDFVDGVAGEFGKRRYYAVFEIGDSQYTNDTPYGYDKLEHLPKEYTQQMAIKNDDVVLIEGGKSINTGNIQYFMEDVALGLPSFLRITRYLKNGDVIITDLEYTNWGSAWTKGFGYEYYYTCDSTRTKNNTIATEVYPYMITDGNNAYLSHWSSWENKQKYQGESVKYLFSKSNGQLAENAIKQIENDMKERMNTQGAEYKMLKRGKEYHDCDTFYFRKEKSTEYILQMERNKGRKNPQITDIKWYDEGKFLIKLVSDDRKEGYRALYDIRYKSVTEC